MFTGIIQEKGVIKQITEKGGIKSFFIEFTPEFSIDLQIGASVAVEGVCLTVTNIINITSAWFDIISKSLEITTLHDFEHGDKVNLERAAKDGCEVGGHPLSGHVDFKAQLLEKNRFDENLQLIIKIPNIWNKYIFPKGYLAVNGCSLTISDVDRVNSTIEIWLIPETRRVTTFNNIQKLDFLNIEIERGTQVVVDTIHNCIEEKFGQLAPVLYNLLESQDIDITKELLFKKI